MNAFLLLLSAAVATAVSSPAPTTRTEHASADHARAAACTDSNYTRLAFWIGNWEVLDSAGTPYATQRVHAVLDDCALTAEWSSAGGNKGLGFFVFDAKAGAWTQMYASNQRPMPMGVKLRRSDPTYHGPGVRFIPAGDDAGRQAQTRVTIRPMPGQRVVEDFEDSADGGKSWSLAFSGVHRPIK